MTVPHALIDTNILVYAFDTDSGRKYAVAKQHAPPWLRQAVHRGNGSGIRRGSHGHG
jgi:predicted nucleic acid-binding protein